MSSCKVILSTILYNKKAVPEAREYKVKGLLTHIVEAMLQLITDAKRNVGVVAVDLVPRTGEVVVADAAVK